MKLIVTSSMDAGASADSVVGAGAESLAGGSVVGAALVQPASKPIETTKISNILMIEILGFTEILLTESCALSE